MNSIKIFKFIAAPQLLGACLLLAAGCWLGSCTHVNLYEKNKTIPNYQWKADYKATGSIEITDTINPYNVYILLRHTDAYKYNNIWLNIGLQPPGDTMQYKRINLVLGTDARGWEGIGLDDIWEVRKLVVAAAPVFTKKGTYNFSIGQVMRDDPLQHIISAGLRVEKVKQ